MLSCSLYSASFTFEVGKSTFRLMEANVSRLPTLHKVHGYKVSRLSLSKRAFLTDLSRIQDTSIRNNILFGEEYDEERYNDTVFACALENDIEGLPEGDETRCGEKGLSLSG